MSRRSRSYQKTKRQVSRRRKSQVARQRAGRVKRRSHRARTRRMKKRGGALQERLMSNKGDLDALVRDHVDESERDLDTHHLKNMGLVQIFLKFVSNFYTDEGMKQILQEIINQVMDDDEGTKSANGRWNRWGRDVTYELISSLIHTTAIVSGMATMDLEKIGKGSAWFGSFLSSKFTPGLVDQIMNRHSPKFMKKSKPIYVPKLDNKTNIESEGILDLYHQVYPGLEQLLDNNVYQRYTSVLRAFSPTSWHPVLTDSGEPGMKHGKPLEVYKNSPRRSETALSRGS